MVPVHETYHNTMCAGSPRYHFLTTSGIPRGESENIKRDIAQPLSDDTPMPYQTHVNTWGVGEPETSVMSPFQGLAELWPGWWIASSQISGIGRFSLKTNNSCGPQELSSGRWHRCVCVWTCIDQHDDKTSRNIHGQFLNMFPICPLPFLEIRLTF